MQYLYDSFQYALRAGVFFKEDDVGVPFDLIADKR